MRLNKTFTALAASITMLASIATSVPAFATSNASDAASNAAPEKKEVTVPEGGFTAKRTTGSLKTFNPHRMTMDTEYTMAFYLTGSLYTAVGNIEKNSFEWIPYHAKEMPKTADNIVWEIPLRDDLKWTDGTPITAKDYEYSMKMSLDPKLLNDNASFLYIELNVLNAKNYLDGKCKWEDVGIKAKDGNVLEITLDKSNSAPVFLASMASTFLVKQDLYEAGMNADKTETTYGTDLQNFPSAGPYKMVQSIPDQFVSIEKANMEALKDLDKDYFKASAIEFSVIKTSAARLQEFLNGNLDRTSISGNDYDSYKDDPRTRQESSNTIWGLFVNSKSPKAEALKNKNIRQALFWGTNRDDISVGIFKSYVSAPFWVGLLSMVGDVTTAPENYRQSEYGKSVMPSETGYEPEKAKELFDKGYAETGSKPIKVELIVFDNDESMEQMAAYLQDSWQQLFGADRFQVEIKKMPAGSAYDAYEKADYDLGVGANGQSATDPWLSMSVWTTNYPGKANQMANEEFDKLVEASTVGDDRLDFEKKKANLKRMEEILLDEVPSIPIFANTNAALYQDNIVFPWDDFLPVVGFGMDQTSRE